MNPAPPVTRIRSIEWKPSKGSLRKPNREDADELTGTFTYGVNHQHSIRFGQVRAGGKAEAAGEEVVGDRAADHLAPGEDRLPVERLPERARFDVSGLQREPDTLPVGTKVTWIDSHAGQPAVVPAPRRLGLERDPGQVAQRLAVPGE